MIFVFILANPWSLHLETALTFWKYGFRRQREKRHFDVGIRPNLFQQKINILQMELITQSETIIENFV